MVHASDSLMRDVYENLDFTSFPTSLNPARINEKYMPDFKGRQYFEYMLNPTITNDEIIIDGDDWFYSFKLLERRKGNLYLCFWDKAKMGTYDVRKPIVIRKYNTDYVAIALDPTSLTGECELSVK